MLKRGDLIDYPDVWPAPKFPTAIITEIFRYKTGEKTNQNYIEVLFENGDTAEMFAHEVYKRVPIIQQKLPKKTAAWSPGDWVMTGSYGGLRDIRGKVLSVDGDVVTVEDQHFHKRRVPAGDLKEIKQIYEYEYKVGERVREVMNPSVEGIVYDLRPDQRVLVSVHGEQRWYHQNELEYDEAPGEGYHWEAGPEDFVNVKGVTISQVDERPDSGVKPGHVWTPWEIIQYDKGKRYIHGTNDREGWIFPEAFLEDLHVGDRVQEIDMKIIGTITKMTVDHVMVLDPPV